MVFVLKGKNQCAQSDECRDLCVTEKLLRIRSSLGIKLSLPGDKPPDF